MSDNDGRCRCVHCKRSDDVKKVITYLSDTPVFKQTIMELYQDCLNAEFEVECLTDEKSHE